MNETKEKEIFIIDDDDIAMFLTERAVGVSDIHSSVTGFNSATGAIEYLKTPSNNWPDLILLDINMPVMNGWDFLDRMKHEIKRRQRTTMVCMLSSTVSQADFDNFHSRDEVAFFLPKPLSSDHLNMVIKSQISALKTVQFKSANKT